MSVVRIILFFNLKPGVDRAIYATATIPRVAAAFTDAKLIMTELVSAGVAQGATCE